jgi:hypothetical protein
MSMYEKIIGCTPYHNLKEKKQPTMIWYNMGQLFISKRGPGATLMAVYILIYFQVNCQLFANLMNQYWVAQNFKKSFLFWNV